MKYDRIVLICGALLGVILGGMFFSYNVVDEERDPFGRETYYGPPGASATMWQDATTFSGDISMNNHDITGWVGSNRDNMAPYDAIIKKTGSTYFGIDANGALINSGSDVGAVFNAVATELKTSTYECYSTIVFDVGASAATSTTMQLYSGMNVQFVGRPTITRTTDVAFFQARQITGVAYRDICLSGCELYYTGEAGDYTAYHIELYNTSYSQINDVHTFMTVSYSTNNNGGILLNAHGSHGWLNYITNCHLSKIEIFYAADNWIIGNTICSWEENDEAIKLSAGCHNTKILKNHIIVPKYRGLYITGACVGLDVSHNWFEPQDAYVSGEVQNGIVTGAAVTASKFVGNSFVNLGQMGMNFNGGLQYSPIADNVFYNCNQNNENTNRCISFGGTSNYNSITGNTAYNEISTTKAPFIWGCNYTSYTGNIAYGYFSDDISNVGTGSIETGTVATLT